MKMLVGMILTLGIMLFTARFMIGNMGDLGILNGGNSQPKGLGELGAPVVDEDVTVYKWVDANGVTHFGSAPPTNQGSYEKQDIISSTNVIQAVKPVEEEEEKPGQRPQIARIGELYSPEGIKDLMEDTKGLQEQLNERMAEQEKLLKDISGAHKK